MLRLEEPIKCLLKRITTFPRTQRRVRRRKKLWLSSPKAINLQAGGGNRDNMLHAACVSYFLYKDQLQEREAILSTNDMAGDDVQGSSQIISVVDGDVTMRTARSEQKRPIEETGFRHSRFLKNG